MDRNFPASLKAVLKHEGGFVHHPKDPGGATNFGITIATFRAYIKPKGTVEDLKKITKDQVSVIYRRQYWDAVLGAQLPDGLDFAVFDYAVNSGPARAIKELQRVVGAVADGKVGPATLAAVKAKNVQDTIEQLCDRRMSFLRGLKTWPTFGKGWSRRVTSVRAEALDISRQPTPEKPLVVEKEITVEVDKPVVPASVEKKVKEKTDRLGFLTTGAGAAATAFGGVFGNINWTTIAACAGAVVVVALVFVLLRSQIVSAVRLIRAELAE